MVEVLVPALLDKPFAFRVVFLYYLHYIPVWILVPFSSSVLAFLSLLLYSLGFSLQVVFGSLQLLNYFPPSLSCLLPPPFLLYLNEVPVQSVLLFLNKVSHVLTYLICKIEENKLLKLVSVIFCYLCDINVAQFCSRRNETVFNLRR